MVFSSVVFLYYFLPVFLILYFLSPGKMKNAVLLFGSLFFYSWGERRLVFMLMATILAGWIAGLLIEAIENKKGKKTVLALSVLIDLGLLSYFKYADFLIGSINGLFGASIPLLKVALPIGISFYTFQILSYTVDVYRGDVKAQKNLVSFAAYVSMFPQLIAGPIVRYADIAAQLDKRTHSFERAAQGMKRFLYGLAKKVLLANVLGELASLLTNLPDKSVLYYWLHAVAFTLQIYYDFSGYSDMAIGLGKLFGFDFAENFDYPYIAGSVTEFWRRWHMSLGSWFRDYVYIPLGGNRKGKGRQLINILIVWMLTGLWHGAAWNFVLWGLFYAVFLMIEKLGLLKWLNKHKVIGHVYTMLLVLLGFVLFNAGSLLQTGTDMAGMLGLGGLRLASAETLYYLRSYAVVILAGAVGATPLPKLAAAKIFGKKRDALQPIFLTCILLVVTAFLVDGSFNPFLYFRF